MKQLFIKTRVRKIISNNMQETDILEHSLGSNKTDENCIYFPHKDLGSPQEDVLDLSLENVSLHSAPLMNKYGLDLTVNKKKDNKTIFDDNNYFVKNHTYKLLPITLEEIDEELIHMEHDYCSISSGSDKEEGFSKTMEISLIKSRVYRRKKEKSSKKGNKNAGFQNCQGSNTFLHSKASLDVMYTGFEKDSHLEELDFSPINLHEKILMHHSEVDYSKLLQPLDLTANIADQKKTEGIVQDNISEDDVNENNLEPGASEININTEDLDGIVVNIRRPDCKDYKPCKKFLSEVAYLVPYLNKNDHSNINILDLTSENVNNSNGHKTVYCVSEVGWKTFKNSSDRIILTNDKNFGKPISANEKDDTPTYLLLDENSLRNLLAKHCQDIGATLNYQVLKDFSGQLGESHIIPENEELDICGDQIPVSDIAEVEVVNNVTTNESIQNTAQPGGIINSGRLKKLLSNCNKGIEKFAGQIKCNECAKENSPCSKCLNVMNKTYNNRTSQKSDKYFTNLSSKKHWNRMVDIENILNSNPIVQEMKSKKGKSLKKKKKPTSIEGGTNSKNKLKKKDLESRCIENPNFIINSGFLKAWLMNSRDSNITQVNNLRNEAVENLVIPLDVDALNQTEADACSVPSFHGSSSFEGFPDASQKSNAVTFNSSSQSSRNGIANLDSRKSKKIFKPVGFSAEKKGGPNLNNENIPVKKTIAGTKKKSIKPSTLKKPRRSLEISIEEIADLGLGMEKRTRSGREAPEVLNKKEQVKKRNKKDLVNIKIENGIDERDLSGIGNATESVEQTKMDQESILKSLLLDAARKITEPSESPVLCDILPNMENLNIPITEPAVKSVESEKKIKNDKSAKKGIKKDRNIKTKKLTLKEELEPSCNEQEVVNKEEIENLNGDTIKEVNVNGGCEENLLFFDNNLTQDESIKSQMQLKEVCMKLENNIAEDMGILSNGFSGNYEQSPTEEDSPKNHVSHLDSNEQYNHHNISNEKNVDATSESLSPELSDNSVEEKNDGVNKVMLRFKNTISEKMKTVANHIDDSSNGKCLKDVDFNSKSFKGSGVRSSLTKSGNDTTSSSKLNKEFLGDIASDLQEIKTAIKKQNEIRKSELNNGNSKDRKVFSEKLKGETITKKRVVEESKSAAEPFRNRLRSKSKTNVINNNNNEKNSTPSKIVFEAPSNENVETSQPAKKKIKSELLAKCNSLPLEKNLKEKAVRGSNLNASLTYERTTRSGKAIENSSSSKTPKADPLPRKKHHELVILNIEESNSDVLLKKEFNLRRRTIDRSLQQTEENTTDRPPKKKKIVEDCSFHCKDEVNKNEKKTKSRFSARLRNK